ncbi:hypothetical protein KC726_05835 [Candidatus Woesebacteria bacterium]|nr:hypothetical protein [Candidatus Woesebacteria bacterium]
MPKSPSHKKAQSKAAGRGGKTETKLKGSRKRLDAITKSGKTATEVERSGTATGLEKAAQRLKMRRSQRKVLQVPQTDMGKAVEAMKKKGVKGTVKNMTGTKRRSV